MPKRACSCRGCTACKGDGSRAHGVLFDAATRSYSCPACRQAVSQVAERQRAAVRGTAAQRGYGTAHVATREKLLAQWEPGQPCAHCGQPMWDKSKLDLAHTADRSGWRGLAHAECNRGNR